MDKSNFILSVNGGSSSIKFSLYKLTETLDLLLYGEIENIGTKKAKLNFNFNADQQKNSFAIDAANHDYRR